MSDVDRKLARAEHHRDELKALLDEYRKRKPYRTDERADKFAGEPYRVVFAYDLEPVPDDAALIFGDVVQNVRATLDYLIGELRRDGPSGDSQFPICDTFEVFRQARASQLSGVPGAACDVIELMQAYGPDPDRSQYSEWPLDRQMREAHRPLRWLQTLWNVDKHRALAVASGWVHLDWASHRRDEPSGIRFRVDRIGGRAEYWVLLDGRDPFIDPHYDVTVRLAPPPRGQMDDWPVGVGEFELDGLAESLCWIVRWKVLNFGLDRFRVSGSSPAT